MSVFHLSDAMWAAAVKLDRQATLDCIEALSRWTHHDVGCLGYDCTCGLALVLAALTAEPVRVDAIVEPPA